MSNNDDRICRSFNFENDRFDSMNEIQVTFSSGISIAKFILFSFLGNIRKFLFNFFISETITNSYVNFIQTFHVMRLNIQFYMRSSRYRSDHSTSEYCNTFTRLFCWKFHLEEVVKFGSILHSFL